MLWKSDRIEHVQLRIVDRVDSFILVHIMIVRGNHTPKFMCSLVPIKGNVFEPGQNVELFSLLNYNFSVKFVDLLECLLLGSTLYRV